MFPRHRHLTTLTELLRSYPVVAILGARQIGKTTLAHQLIDQYPGATTLFDLEDPVDLAQLDQAKLALEPLSGLVIIDEIQHRPELFPLLRVLVDRRDNPATFLILGSAAPELLRQSSESLAGRIHYHHLGGLSLDEVGIDNLEDLWLRGGFPRSLLAEGDAESALWRRDFIRTFLERDLPQLGVRIPSITLRRFWAMLSHYHGQTWNAAELARAFGIGATTVRRYLDLLTSTFVVRQLLPWYENIGKRQVKAPKIYISDSGLLHALLGVETLSDLQRHPKIGASWEGFALQETIVHLGAEPEECFFWAAHTGAEIDLLIVRGQRRLGFEFKRADAPRTTRSMHRAIEHLGLDHLDVIYPGQRTYPLGEKIRAVPLARIFTDLG